MRISSLHIFNIANKGIADANQAISKTQEQLSSGKRVLTPSDDPVAATKIMQLEEELAVIEQYTKNIEIAENNLALQESTLSSASNLLLRIKEIAVQAGNTATLSPNEYESLAAEVDARLDEMLNILNSRNPGGDYIFGGFKSKAKPFAGSPTQGFNYHGNEGQQEIKVASNTQVATSDSGKKIFVDVVSSENTVNTYPSESNQSSTLRISPGQIVDQDLFDEFYPEDLVITFNADADIFPPGKNFTATERSSGRIIAENQPYTSGEFLEINGVSFRISGAANSGQAAVPATRSFGLEGALTLPIDFTAPAESTFQIEVNGRTETLVLDANLANTSDLSDVLNSTANGNAAKLANLGLVVDGSGIRMPRGVNFAITNGSAAVDSAMGLNTSSGTTSADGRIAEPGDRLFIDSSNKQDVLTTLANFSLAMQNYDGSEESRDQLSSVVATTLENIDNAQVSILNTVSEIGARINTLESTKTLHTDSEFVISEILGEIRDVDYAEAATRLSAQSMVLQAAQSSFIRVSQLTLFSQL